MAREYPHDLVAERSLLGSMLISSDVCQTVLSLASKDDFYLDSHRILFEAMQNIYADNSPVDVTTLTSYLIDKKLLDKTGGVEYLLELSESVPTTSHSEHYLKRLNEKALLRRLIKESTEIIEKAYGDVENINDFIGEVEKDFLNVTRDRNAGEFQNVKSVIQKVTDRLVMLQKADGKISGVKTGYYDLDKLTSGLQKGDLIILAARPSVGKTAFALNVAYNVSYKSDEAVAIFSLEMPAEQLIQRIICSAGSLKAESLRSGSILKESSERYYAAADKVSKCNLYIDDTPGIRVGEIAAKCRRLKREQGLKMIVIDYLQLISGPANSRESRQQEVSDISRQLKMIARELEVPVLALSQLSRSVEKRDNKRPVLSDLRESGSIEQDADIVSFIHREDYQDPKKEAETQGATDIIIAKHRNGALADIRLVFLKQFSKFANPARSDQQINPLEGVKDLRI
ncbi:MAG TPA: replicative DNA helicase [Candidatus Massiliomicrobiota merdigallinarum]|nr:replicative DNA helicase [Candidatus Massilimicrobiota merdigallinarum]